MASRRKALGWVALGALAPLVGCTITSGSDDGGDGTCSAIPEETEGPYPGDGSNGPNVLEESGVVRSDITTSFGALSGTAAGVPLTLTLTVVDASACTPMSNAAVYVWHADRDGKYSLYTASNQNYLRGVQASASDGTVTFKTIFPGAYDGRWPHVHFEVYESVDAATSGEDPIITSQLALPEATCDEVYATAGYEASVSNLAKTSLDDDMVFGDGYDTQLASVTGSVTAGYTATLTIGV